MIIGHNQDIAWGFTNLGPDVTDLYLEKVRGKRWLYDGRFRPLAIRTETIEVADGDDFELVIRETEHGPLLSDVSQGAEHGRCQRRGARGTRPRQRLCGRAQVDRARSVPTADAILGLNRASNWEEFRATAGTSRCRLEHGVRRRRGAHRLPARFMPIRESGEDAAARGRLARENDWSGREVPFDALP